MKSKEESVKEIELNLKELLFILSEAFANERRLAVESYIEKLKKKMKSDYYNKDRIIQLMEEAQKEIEK